MSGPPIWVVHAMPMPNMVGAATRCCIGPGRQRLQLIGKV